jgi:uncharacterized protein YjiS (DUF1127 family)
MTVALEPRVAHEVTLVDLLDRLLGSGVVVAGDVTLSVADIDLVLVDLRTLVASVGSLGGGLPPPLRPAPAPAAVPERPREQERAETPAPLPRPRRPRRKPGGVFPRRIEADPERLEKGLAQLVMTIVELLRELMERQALRRMDDGTLSDAEIERLGETFMLLEQRMGELKEVFGLTDEDLNLNLGPLGTLL